MTALVMAFDGIDAHPLDQVRLPPPWYVPTDQPACGAELDVPASATTDGLARRFVCDKPAHAATERHRQVTDINGGTCIEWSEETRNEIDNATRTRDGAHRS